MTILDAFFKLGDKVTGGDPKRKLSFDYYMLWTMFLAFFSILLSNLWDFYKFQSLASLGWAFVMVAILWFQYNALKGVRTMKNAYVVPKTDTKPLELESIDKMMEEFKS